MNKRGRIFISLASEDTALADALKDALRQLLGDAVTVHYSTSAEPDTGISHGADWFQWIGDQVKACDLAFILITPNSINRPWLLWESGAVHGAAVTLGGPAVRKVRPVAFGVPTDQLPAPLRRIQVLKGDRAADIRKLLIDVINQYKRRLPTSVVMAAGKRVGGTIKKYLHRVAAILARDLASKTQAAAALPHLSMVIEQLVAVRQTHPDLAGTLQEMAAELLEAMILSFRTNNLGVNDDLTEAVVKSHMPRAISISAYETTGPASWVNPTIYRYLAPQIRQYLWKNIERRHPAPVTPPPGKIRTPLGRWNLVVAPWLGKAIKRAIANANQKLRSESLTIFDNPEELHWTVGPPKLQYSRVLLWSRDELEHPIADSVISIHEAFNVPLFFLEVAPRAQEKAFAYVVFEKKDGEITGLFGRRKDNYKTQSFEHGRIPGVGRALDMYKELLGRKELMFAVDARESLRGGAVAT